MILLLTIITDKKKILAKRGEEPPFLHKRVGITTD